jgi:hypothetical protein
VSVETVDSGISVFESWSLRRFIPNLRITSLKSRNVLAANHVRSRTTASGLSNIFIELTHYLLHRDFVIAKPTWNKSANLFLEAIQLREINLYTDSATVSHQDPL